MFCGSCCKIKRVVETRICRPLLCAPDLGPRRLADVNIIIHWLFAWQQSLVARSLHLHSSETPQALISRCFQYWFHQYFIVSDQHSESQQSHTLQVLHHCFGPHKKYGSLLQPLRQQKYTYFVMFLWSSSHLLPQRLCNWYQECCASSPTCLGWTQQKTSHMQLASFNTCHAHTKDVRFNSKWVRNLLSLMERAVKFFPMPPCRSSRCSGTRTVSLVYSHPQWGNSFTTCFHNRRQQWQHNWPYPCHPSSCLESAGRLCVG